MTQGTTLPVERLASLTELTAGKVRYEQGVYNMGLVSCNQGYYGIFRNSTRNARHLLGWPFMAEGEYKSDLWHILLSRDFKLLGVRQIWTFDKIIHDVRMSGGMIGCEKVGEKDFRPVMLKWDEHFRLHATRLSNGNAKNWNYLPGGWVDCGSCDGKLVRRSENQASIVNNLGLDLRGSAPYFHIGDRLITTYHTVQPDHQGRRSYWHYFAELHPNPPFHINRLSPPFKFGRGEEAGRIQFLMSIFQEPGNPKNHLVSFGESDADNCIGRIREADVLGLLL